MGQVIKIIKVRIIMGKIFKIKVKPVSAPYFVMGIEEMADRIRGTGIGRQIQSF